MKKTIYILDGLGCADCSNKIERKINKLPYIETATLNFATKTLTLSSKKEITDEAISEIKKIVDSYEKGVQLVEKGKYNKNGDDETSVNKKMVPTLIGAILFLLALIFTFPEPWKLILFISSYLLVGYNVLFQALSNIRHGRMFDENFLMSIASIGAFLIGQNAEAVAIILFYKVGEFFQDKAVERSRKSIASLMDIRPDFANLIHSNALEKVNPELVKKEDLILVKPGEKVPLDGIITKGKSTLDTSALTGESLPKKVVTGEQILSGSINLSGLITVKVTALFKDSTVTKILNLVQNASAKKAKTENFITKFAAIYTPIVVGLAALLAIVPPLIIPDATFIEWVNRALVFLVISCPCALVISIPLSFFGGIGGASKQGILVKGGNYLEALNNVSTAVFDKTGTLTKGNFIVTDIISGPGFTKDELLKLAAYGENYSNHPIATPITNAYKETIDESNITNYKEIAGKGISATIEGKEVLLGNQKLLNDSQIKNTLEDSTSVGTKVNVIVNNRFAGYLVIADEIKKDSKNAIADLKKLGVEKTVMLTGDNEAVAKNVSHELGLDAYYSELLPADKATQIEKFAKENTGKGSLIFVGDGINDAPVLARADVGIAMGGVGSDAALKVADIVIMTDEPSKIPTAITIAKKTRRIVWQNIIFAMSFKIVFLILGAFGIATMWEAVFADVGVALIAILNASRVLNIKIKE